VSTLAVSNQTFIQPLDCTVNTPVEFRSTVWKNTAILSEKEIKELKDAYFAEASSTTKPVASGSSPAVEELSGHAGAAKAEQPSKPAKSKLKLKKKAEDPFASDPEEGGEAPIANEPIKRRRKADDIQVEEVERPKKKRAAK